MATQAQVDIILNGKATGLSAAIRGVKGELFSFSNTLKAGFGFSIGAKLAEGVLGIGSAIKAGIDGATQFASQLQDLSTAAGLGVEPFQVLARSAKLSGAQMEDVSKAIVTVGEKTREALSGPGGAADAFAVLGIDVKKFIDLAPERQIEMLGQAFATAKDPGAAFHAIMELLGAKTAPKLRAMLTELGEQGLNKLGRDMSEAGLLMRKDVIDVLDESGDKADDSATRFKTAWGDVAVALQPLFSGLRKMGEWLADGLSWVLLKLEKIGIAAATIAAMASDILTGDFKGLAVYQAAAEELAQAAEDRAKAKKDAPIVGTEAKPPTGGNLADSKQAAYEMKQIADAVAQAQQRAGVEVGRIARDFNLTNEQRKAATTAILQKESDAIVKEKELLGQIIVKLAKADPKYAETVKQMPGANYEQIARQLGKGPDGNKQIGGAVDQYDKLGQAKDAVQEQNFEVNKDPKTVMQGVDDGLTKIQDRWGTLAGQISSSVATIGDAISGSLGGAMNELLGTTEYWSQSLGKIAGPIMGAVSQSISKMFADWIVARAAAMVKNIAASTAEGTAETAAKAPGALMSSISSFGVAAAVGVAAFLAAKALGGGFFEGGFTGLGNPRDAAGIVHRGEFVIPHDVTKAMGPGALAGLVDSVRNPSQSTPAIPGLMPQVYNPAGPGATGAKADEPWVQTPQTLFVDHRDQDLIDRVLANPKLKTKVIRIGRANTGDFGSPT